MKKIILTLFLIIILIIACEKVTNLQYHIDSDACNSCGRCIEVCPVDAIEYGPDGKAVIDQTRCNQCGQCQVICPREAVY